jgi:hypothetical protein
VLGPGTYAFNDNYKFSTGYAAASAILNYSINVEQTAVPLPPALVLFGSGIFGLAGFAATKKKAKLSANLPVT